MARFNKIYAGPVSELLPQVAEKQAAESILPGSVVAINADDEFELHGTAGGRGAYFVAQDNYLILAGVDTPVAAGDVVIGMRPLDEQFFNVRVAAGTYVQGDTLSSAGDGTLAASGAGDEILFYSEESVTLDEADLLRVRVATGSVAAA